jgi:GntR family transcriptional regulator/MocR family aminotransferase
MTGVLGYSNEEQDIGRWWVDEDRWYRRWSRWNYGEAKGYYIVIDGEQIKWFNEDRQIVDSAYIRLADERPAVGYGSKLDQ